MFIAQRLRACHGEEWDGMGTVTIVLLAFWLFSSMLSEQDRGDRERDLL